MYIAMNRFEIREGSEEKFEEIWKARDSKLLDVRGFIGFHLIRGEKRDGFTLYASHSTWIDREAFQNWTQSAAFRDAHKNAGQHREIYRGHPVFEGFEVVV